MLLHRDRFDRDLEEEMRLHLDLQKQQQIVEGLSADDARTTAQRRFGNTTLLQEECRDAYGWQWLEEFARDLRYAARSMLRTPGFTAVAIVALALGIGANAALFSVVNAVLLRPLAYRDAGRLVTILHNGRNPVAPANYVDFRAQSNSFTDMGAAEFWTPNLTRADPPEHIRGLRLTQGILPLLGVEPLLGRWFEPGEDRKGSEHAVILSYRLWQRRFAGDPNILLRSLILDGEAYQVVGVMPRDFQFAPFWATRTELWAPLPLSDRIQNRDGNSLRVFARLKPDVGFGQARAEMAALTARLEREHPGTNRQVMVTPLKENVVGKVETPLLLLLGAVGFVLLIACANVAHMLLARAATRQKETAVRAALGARHGRLFRQFLTESAFLGACGGIAGLALAVAGTRALIALSPARIPRVETVTIDTDVLLFLLGTTILTCLAFGLAPAMQAARLDITSGLKDAALGSSDGIGRGKARNSLVASEFALAVVLLVGAGLMVRSFFALQAIDPGFNPHHVLSLIVSVAGSKEAGPDRRAIFYRQLVDRVRTLPGVESAAAINHLPLAGDLWTRGLTIEGRPEPRPGEEPNAVYRVITPGYFHAMRLPLLRGRDFTGDDDTRAPGVVIINDRAAKAYWPGEDPVGKHVSLGSRTQREWLTIIGIATDAAEADWAARAVPEIYLPTFQNRNYLSDRGAYITLVARTAGDPAALTSVVKNVVWSFDSNLPISEIVTMDGVIAEANAEPRFEMLLLSVFAAVALVLAAVGIYGVMSYSVSRRTHEIGIRMSLGGTRTQVLWMVVRQGMWLALAGSAAGIGGALALAQLMTGVLYGVRPTDPLTFAAVAIGLAAVALVATYIPARRATRIDPMSALRYE
jgi:putative ABC transport system permease protein